MITRQLVEQYQGKIWVESEIGQGSNFTFKLKLQEEEKDLEQGEQITESKLNYAFQWVPANNSTVQYVNDFDS